MSKEKWAKAHVKARIKENEKSYHPEMPDRVVYPAGPIKMQIGKPVDHMGATLLLGELLYEFRREVARLSPRRLAKARGSVKWPEVPIPHPALPTT